MAKVDASRPRGYFVGLYALTVVCTAFVSGRASSSPPNPIWPFHLCTRGLGCLLRQLQPVGSLARWQKARGAVR